MKTGSIVGSPTTKNRGVTDASTGYQKLLNIPEYTITLWLLLQLISVV
jgi:hypothetical protein